MGTPSPGCDRRRAVFFAGALTVIVSALGLYAIHREGSWEQAPAWDVAWFHTLALRAKRAMEERGIAGLVESWVAGSGTHTPLVRTLSGLLMLVLGESTLAAEAILPIATFVFFLATYRVVERLYDARTAAWTTALAASFPVVLSLSRTYLFEMPLAAVVASACWAMLASESFQRRGPTLAFGLLLGLAGLARAGGVALLVGPAIVGLVAAARRAPPLPKPVLGPIGVAVGPFWGARARLAANFGVASSVAAVVMSTWYVPNAGSLVRYLHSVTYGSRAHLYAGGDALSAENAVDYLRWLVLDGPGVPMACVAACAVGVVALETRGRSLLSGTMAACIGALAIDFGVLMVAAQRCRAVLFLAVMPIVALAIVRAIASVRDRGVRTALGVIVAALALHHVVALTFTFSVPADPARDFGPLPRATRLWNHTTVFAEMTHAAKAPPRTDFHVKETIDRLERFGLPTNAEICVASEHPFFQVNALRLEAERRRHRWTFWYFPPVTTTDPFGWPDDAREVALRADALVAREKAGDPPPPILPLLDGAGRVFAPAARLPLGDGSSARIQRREPTVAVRSRMPDGLQPVKARFVDPAFERSERVALAGGHGPAAMPAVGALAMLPIGPREAYGSPDGIAIDAAHRKSTDPASAGSLDADLRAPRLLLEGMRISRDDGD
ncbi:MAG TPA: glycosyltransferase family 39 protein, partial [Planctomycetota bacterium]|nr:glycosyltransferase family 39 protein [Planctomycetota bacterium]